MCACRDYVFKSSVTLGLVTLKCIGFLNVGSIISLFCQTSYPYANLLACLTTCNCKSRIEEQNRKKSTKTTD